MGARRGSPLSPNLFILGVETLDENIRTNRSIQGIIAKESEIKISQYADDTIFTVPAGFWPRRPEPEDASYMSPRIREENFTVAEKISIFQEQGLQGIAEKYARDCRNFVGGRRNTRRRLGAESLHKILKWKGNSCP